MKNKYFWLLIILCLTACSQATSPTANPAQTQSILTPTETGSTIIIPTLLNYPEPEATGGNTAIFSGVTNDSRYGIPQVDRVLDALFRDPTQLTGLVAFITAPCTLMEGFGGPPKCAPGETEGTSLEVLPVLGPEGGFFRKSEFNLPGVVGQINLVGVFRVNKDFVSEKYYPAGSYGIVLQQIPKVSILVIRVTESGVVRLDYPTQLPGREQPDFEKYLNPQP